MAMLKQLLTEQEAVDEVRRIINSALGKRWMIAVWCVDEAEKPEEPNVLRLAGQTTWRFPTGDFEESLRLLRERIEENARSKTPAVPAPLEIAPFLLDEMNQEEEAEEENHQRDGDLNELFRGHVERGEQE